ncbi:acyl-CoA mutase large subunit family protein [Candidatus Formimonas warabiya]|uniref:Methylmalonyl-CoA mutase n=1 Tax=Formimonas warabiya TaxID=1761012 RepID=A0A3G1KUI5_FORW1|nr:methylmalonyl-CoA mutase family protein [Candidatus Formimonas warabiya]ATW26084.1 methylmalonyl-CoA mutase [Candidatus Formimonas warabiya]
MSQKEKKYQTMSGIPLKELYAQTDLERIEFDDNQDLNRSGQYPFTRGIKPGMYRDELWIMGQYSGFGSAEEANLRYRYLLEQGQTGFSIALDLPTQIGLDSDSSLSCGEVGKVGVAIDSLEDMEKLFDGIPLEKVRQIRTTANSIGPLMTALIVGFAEKKGIDPNMIKVLLQNDPLKEYFARGTYVFPPDAAVKLAVDVIEYCAHRLTNWVPQALSGYHIRESGATAVQELAFCYANGISYFKDAVDRGLNIDQFAPKMYTFFAAQMDLLEEVAKFRAARRVWAKMMKEQYGAKDPDSMKLSILAYTAGGALTAQQPLNNVARVTIEALAAVLGGVQTLATSSFDEAFSIPTEQAVTVALRTQQIIAHESGIVNTVDPLGGSYVVESLTSEIEKGVHKYLGRISEMGGAVACIRSGYFQRELVKEAYQYQKSIETGERIIVGVNAYQSGQEENIPIFVTGPETEERQVKRLHELRGRRDGLALAKAMDHLKKEATAGKNIIPAAVEAVKAYATLGEITECLKEVYGTYKDLGIY